MTNLNGGLINLWTMLIQPTRHLSDPNTHIHTLPGCLMSTYLLTYLSVRRTHAFVSSCVNLSVCIYVCTTVLRAFQGNKLENNVNLHVVNEIADMKNCNNCIYLEARKKKDLYMWVSRVPHGPSCKFLLQNVHTMAEVKLTGNCLKASRPMLHFCSMFEQQAQFKVMKEVRFCIMRESV
jgi:hypothetical protein